MYEAGTILYFDPFYFKNGNTAKPKYFIILHNDGNNSIVASLPTRTDSVPSSLKTIHGCINDTALNFNCYHFEANKPINDEGFCFEMPTFIYGYQVDDFSLKLFQNIYKVENVDYTIVGKLSKHEYMAILHCFSRSKSVPNKFKKIFFSIIS